MFSFARYALDSIVRNRRRTLYAILGVTLAVSLIAGSLIAVDSASLGLLRERLDGIPVDFYGEPSYTYSPSEIDSDRYESVTEKLLDVGGVEDASYLVTNFGWYLLNGEGVKYQEESYYWYPSSSIVFLPEDPSVILDRYGITGEAPSPGTVALPSNVATFLDLSVGDEVVCSYESGTYDYVNDTYTYAYVNVTLEVSQIWTQELMAEDYWRGWYPEPMLRGDVCLGGVRNPVVIPMESAPLITAPLSDVSSQAFTEVYLVWIDRDKYVSLANVQLSIDDLSTLGGRLERAAREADVRFHSPLSSVLYELGSDLGQKKLTFVGLSLPVIVLGLYLSLVGVEMGMTERRREMGVLKSRGARDRQVFASLISESVLLGALAGLLGLAIGFLVSRFLLVAVSSLFDSESTLAAMTSFFVSAWTVVIVTAFGILLMLVSSYRPMKRASRMSVAESLHQYTPRTVKVEYRSRYDIAALVLVAYSIVSVFWLYESIPSWRGGSLVLVIVVSLSAALGWAIVPATPFLLSVSVTRLVTRGSRRMYTRFSYVVRRWTKELHYLVEKNIARNPKRASNIGIIVSLAVAFGLFVSITMESELAHAEKVVLYEVGADIRYTGYPMYNGTGYSAIDYSLLGSIDTLEGVRDSVMFRPIYVQADHDGASMVMFDSEGLADMIDIDSGWYSGDGSEDIRDLSENGTVFVSQDFAYYTYVEVGDILDVVVDTYPDEASDVVVQAAFELRVIGVLDQLPGLSHQLYVDSGTLSFIEPDWYPEYWEMGFFVMVDHGADHSSVADGVQDLCYSAGLDGYVVVAEDRLEDVMSAPEFRTLRDFLYMEYALSLVMMTCGVGLVLFITVWDRRHELACIMARGASAQQMRRILMGESISLMTLGMVVGVVSGLLSAYMYSVLVYRVGESAVSRDLTFSWISWAVVLSAIASFMLASYLATYSAGRLRLAEVLRIRGG